MIQTVVIIVSVLLALGANFIAILVHRRAVRAQTFVTIVNTARSIKFSKGMDIIRHLPVQTYDEFRHSVSQKDQACIREVIDFLNDLQHLINYDYLSQEHVVRIYRVSILDCRRMLLPWWVDGFRNETGNEENKYDYYSAFVQLCNTAMSREKKR